MKTGSRLVILLVPAILVLPTGCNQGSLEAEREAWEAEKSRLEQTIQITQDMAEQREKQHREQSADIQRAAREEQENLLKQIEKELENTRLQMERTQQAERDLAEAKSLLARAGISMRAQDGQAPADMKAEAARKREAMVTIEGDGGKGFGVLVNEEGKLWLYTAAHVLGGQMKLTVTGANGNKITRFGQLQIAGESDLVRLEVQGAEGLAGLEWVPAERGLREKMGLLVVADGDPRVSAIDGLPPAPGKPVAMAGGGTPVGGAVVLDQSDAGLLGVVALADAKRGELFERTGARLSAMNSAFLRPGGDVAWKTLSVNSFLAEGRMIAEYDAMTRLAMAMAGVRYVGGRIQFEGIIGPGVSAMRILEENKKIPAVAELLAFNSREDVASKKIKPNEQDVKRKALGILTSIAAAVRQSAQGFEPAKFTGIHRVMAEESAGWRAPAEQAMREALAAAAKP